VQHGDWLHSPTLQADLNPTDVVVFTDGDMLLQRGLNDSEQMLLRTLQDNEVFIGRNKDLNDTLRYESERIQPTAAFRVAGVPDQDNTVYNGGVIAMRVETWMRFYSLYRAHWPVFSTYFNHYAKGQWLISWLLGRFGFNVLMQPLTFHCHNHYPTPSESSQDANGIVSANGQVVLFKHFQPYGHKWK
jgi:calcineurin-like phosphoesterase family protein